MLMLNCSIISCFRKYFNNIFCYIKIDNLVETPQRRDGNKPTRFEDYHNSLAIKRDFQIFMKISEIFFHDLDIVRTFYPFWKRKIHSKIFQVQKISTFFVKIENVYMYFSKTSFCRILNIFWTFYQFLNQHFSMKIRNFN